MAISDRARTSSFVLTLFAWALLVGAIVRLRVHHDSALPSTHPVWWLLLGSLQDLAVLGFAAGIALLVRRWPSASRPASIGFGLFAVAVTIMSIVRSEAVVYFGDVIRPEDLRGDIPVTVGLHSLTGAPVFLFALSIVLLALALVAARRINPQTVRSFGSRRAFAMAVIATFCAVILARVVPRAGLARNAIVSLAVIEQEWMESPHTSFDIPPPDAPSTAIREFVGEPDRRSYLNIGYPLAYRSQSDAGADSFSAVKPNIVLVVMESVRAEEVGCYGDDPPAVTPNLDAIARQGIRFDPAFSAGTYTASADLAIWYGLPPVPREVLITSRPSVQITGLPEILRAKGWRTFLWIHGGDSNFYRRDSFYIPRGIQVVDGRSFPDDQPSTNWGYSDRALMLNAITILNRAREPFAAMVLTVTNHHPFQLPSDADPPMPLPSSHTYPARARTADMVQTVHYTDEAIGDFIKAARRQPWFSHTIFVFTGDHGSTIPPFSRVIATKESLLQQHSRVPLIIYSPLLPGGVVIKGPASHIDILPTLLRLVGSPLRTGLGVNLFDRDAVAERVLPQWNAHQRTLTLITASRSYHAAYPAAGPLDQQIPAEKLIDPIRDPTGLHDLAKLEPQTLSRFHELAKIYVSVYPWLVVNGRSGLPPAILRQMPILHAQAASSTRTPL